MIRNYIEMATFGRTEVYKSSRTLTAITLFYSTTLVLFLDKIHNGETFNFMIR